MISIVAAPEDTVGSDDVDGDVDVLDSCCNRARFDNEPYESSSDSSYDNDSRVRLRLSHTCAFSMLVDVDVDVDVVWTWMEVLQSVLN